jgi:hypothetical protein
MEEVEAKLWDEFEGNHERLEQLIAKTKKDFGTNASNSNLN